MADSRVRVTMTAARPRPVEGGAMNAEQKRRERVRAKPGHGSARKGPPDETDLEMLGLLAAGLVNKQIAQYLGVTEDVVKYRISGLLTRLDASNRAHAVSKGYRRGLLKVPEGVEIQVVRRSVMERIRRDVAALEEVPAVGGRVSAGWKQVARALVRELERLCERDELR